MIQQVTIKNFKCFRDVTVDLEPFTVFVGANGSGKTSFLQAVDLLCRTFRLPPAANEQEYSANRTYGSTDGVEVRCRSNDLFFRYRSAPHGHALEIPSRSVQPNFGHAIARPGSPLEWIWWKPEIGPLPSTIWLRLDTNSLKNSGEAHSPDPRLMSEWGNGLHSATASINLEDPDLWLKLQDDLRRVVPAIRRLRHTPQNELLFDTVNGKGLRADQVSEGTLLTLGLLTAIHGPIRPGLLLLDDLDRALHPKAQRRLIDLLREVQATNPAIQIVGSTHSPYLLDRMQPGEVQVMYLCDDGSSACEPLTHHPKFSKWKDEFHPGEMWSFFGEEWVGTEKEVAAK